MQQKLPGTRILKSSEWEYIKVCVDFLKPFKDVTVAISGDKYATLGMVYPLYSILLQHCASTLAEIGRSNELFGPITDCEDKLKGYFPTMSKLAYCATFLDARFKDDLFGKLLSLSSNNRKGDRSEQLKAEIQQFFLANYDAPLASTASTSSPAAIEDSSLLGALFKKRRFNDNDAGSESMVSEWNRFATLPRVSENIASVVWWKINHGSFPRMALYFLGAPGQEVAVERMFSSARRLISWERTRLADSTVQECECTKSWLKEFK